MKCKVLYPLVRTLFTLPSLYASFLTEVYLLTADLPPRRFSSLRWDVHLFAKKLFFMLNPLKGVLHLLYYLNQTWFSPRALLCFLYNLSREGCSFCWEPLGPGWGKGSEPSSSTLLLLDRASPSPGLASWACPAPSPRVYAQKYPRVGLSALVLLSRKLLWAELCPPKFIC